MWYWLPRCFKLMSTETRYWFRRKRSGYGWGLPCSWQGRVFFLIWLAALLTAAVKLIPGQPFVFTMALTVLMLILIAVCYIKGEPLAGD